MHHMSQKLWQKQKRTELQHGYFKTRSNGNLKLLKQKQSFCSRLYKREKNKYFNNIDSDKINDNICFWKTLKPFLSDKSGNTWNISLVDRGKNLAENKDAAKMLIQYFSTAVNSLNIIENKSLVTETENFEDPVKIAKKFENHPIVFSVKDTILISINFFNFQKYIRRDFMWNQQSWE